MTSFSGNKIGPSSFESLSSELLVEIADYLNGCDLYYAFYGLNQRISTIIDHQCHRLHVNFVDISKLKFDRFCKRILPKVTSRVVSLTFSGDNSSTPGQLTLFLSYFPSFSQIFLNLESFKLINFIKHDVEILLHHLPSLKTLKRLSIGENIRLMPFNINTEELFKVHINLPITLCSLSFPYEISNEWIQSLNTTIILLQELNVPCIHINQFSLLLQKLPSLQRLTTILMSTDQSNAVQENNLQVKTTSHRLKYLNINITNDILFDEFASILQNLPELCSLSVEALNPDLKVFEADRWESILPRNLVSFHFDLTSTLPTNRSHRELLETFKTKFWITHEWFVQLHLRDYGRYFRLLTIKSPIVTILYWPDDETSLGSPDVPVYLNVTHIELWWNLTKPTHAICPNVRSIQFYGVHQSDDDEPIDANVDIILKCLSFKHIIINTNQPVTPTRFASILLNSSDNAQVLTCSLNWLLPILVNKEYEWICLLIMMRIRKLIINDDEVILSNNNLITFCRTFINLEEIHVKMESIQDFIFLVNVLTNLTMIKVILPSHVANNIIDIRRLINDETSVLDFFLRNENSTSDISKLILWIGSRRIRKSIPTLKTINYLQ